MIQDANAVLIHALIMLWLLLGLIRLLKLRTGNYATLGATNGVKKDTFALQ